MSRKKKLILAGLILGTIVLGVGAVFFAPLIYLSATCLGGAVAIGQAEFQRRRSNSQVDLPKIDNPDDLSGENLEVELHIQHRHIHRVGVALAQPLENVENKRDRDQKSDPPKARNKL